MDPLQTLADALWCARTGGLTAAALPGLKLHDAYAVAALNHQRRLASGDTARGRKIGHTNPANWGAQGILAPSWGWLYDTTTWCHAPPEATGWREPKVELELVLRIRTTPPADTDPDDLLAWSHCVDAMAIGLEFVDRPYAQWGGSVADSVAAGGVHAGLVMGPWQPWPDDAVQACGQLRAELNVAGNAQTGGSAAVLGSPLRALAALQTLVLDQGAMPLQAGEWITTGALAPALLWQVGERIQAQITDGHLLKLSLSL